MADEIRQFSISVPGNTPASAALSFPMTFPPRDVQGLEIIVPVGSSGLVGFAIDVGGAQVIPYLSDPWIITAGEIINWPLEHMPNSGAWSVRAYNTGQNDHAVRFRWLLKYVTGTSSLLTPTLISVDEINALAPSATDLTGGAIQ